MGPGLPSATPEGFPDHPVDGGHQTTPARWAGASLGVGLEAQGSRRPALSLVCPQRTLPHLHTQADTGLCTSCAHRPVSRVGSLARGNAGPQLGARARLLVGGGALMGGAVVKPSYPVSSAVPTASPGRPQPPADRQGQGQGCLYRQPLSAPALVCREEGWIRFNKAHLVRL